MFNRQVDTPKSESRDYDQFFTKPSSARQNQYELIRAIIVDKISIPEASARFGYKVSTTYSLLRDFKSGKIDLFPIVTRGPAQRRTSQDVQDKIIKYRKCNLSTTEIETKLKEHNIQISARTIERILKEAGYEKLKRRTNSERGVGKKRQSIPKRAERLNFEELKPFSFDCPSVGVFFFIPYIIESRVLDIVQKCKLPESQDIPSLQASLSMLILKLIGCKRLSHIDKYDQEPGLGVFAGLNVLPKPTYISSYSCRCSESELLEFQSELITSLKKQFPQFYCSECINLDFHSIPHFGDDSEMEKVWCGARNKTMKGANTVFVQDSQSNAILYTRGDILRSEGNSEILKFIDYWERIKGKVSETLVFDCRFTTYQILDQIATKNINFITLRKRSTKLVNETMDIPENEWQKVNLSIPKRKYNYVSVHENDVKLSNCKNTFRQIIIKDHGRSKPTFIITNNNDLELKEIIKVYAKRWRIESKLSELVSFFNLNALSSPIMIRIHFDILWTLVADTLYNILSKDLRRFEKNIAPTIFRKFIDMPGKVVYDGTKFMIKIRKRSHTPVLKEVEKLSQPFSVPWLSGKTMEIIWQA
jgi:transposase